MTNTEVLLHREFEPLIVSRKNFYQFLYHLFQMPSSDKKFWDIRNQVDLEELENIHEGGTLLHRFFLQLTNERIKTESEEYQRLFLGPGPIAAPPWESYYRSKEQLLFEEWTFQVREQYHQFGLQYIKENNEPDDHLLLELEFMIYLIDLSLKERTLDRFIESISSQYQFLTHHLAIWIPYFCKKIIEETKSQLFLGAAMLLEDFINDDLHTLQEIKEALANVR